MTLSLLKKEENPRKGLCWFEWVIMAYTVFTLIVMAIVFPQLPRPGTMISLRVVGVLMTVALWAIYRRWPCRLTMMFRVAGQMVLLSSWYPDTYEFNRILPNLDHLFASWEQALFGCQPALVFSQNCPSPWVSELLSLGYVSYFPMIATVSFYYFFQRYERLAYAAFVILGSFFLFYVIFLFLPVAGPQYYYQAVGCDQIAQGVFPDIGHYFLDHQESLTIPGYHDGVIYHLLQFTHNAGERPTAAFPSSHVGITTVLLWLIWEVRSKKVFLILLPLGILMFFATFYIQAHYAIDAIAGLPVGTAMYFLLKRVYQALPRETY